MVNGSEVSPYFFFSYDRDDYDDDPSFMTFFDDLRKTVAAEIGRDKDNIAFRDTTNIGLGTNWAPQLTHALRTCECFVPVLTPRMINNSFCGYEWQAFQSRLDAATWVCRLEV
jgi:TIR domain